MAEQRRIQVAALACENIYTGFPISVDLGLRGQPKRDGDIVNRSFDAGQSPVSNSRPGSGCKSPHRMWLLTATWAWLMYVRLTGKGIQCIWVAQRMESTR